MTGDVTFTPTLDDYVEANRAFFRRSSYRRLLLWLGAASVVLAVGNITLKTSTGHSLVWALNDSIVMIVFPAICWGIVLLAPWTTRRAVRKMLSQKRESCETDRLQVGPGGHLVHGAERLLSPVMEYAAQVERDDRGVRVSADRPHHVYAAQACAKFRTTRRFARGDDPRSGRVGARLLQGSRLSTPRP